MKVAQKQVQIPAGTGNFDVAVTGYGTEKGFLTVAPRHDANDTQRAHANLAIGLGDGTEALSSAVAARDNVASSSIAKRRSAQRVYQYLDVAGTAEDAGGDFSAVITDGVQFNQTNAGSLRYMLSTVLFGGGASDQVEAGQFAPNTTQNGTTDKTTPGFKPRVIFLVTGGSGFGGGVQAHSALSFGIAWDDGGTIRNLSVSMNQEDAVSITECYSLASDTRSAVVLNEAGGIAWSIEITALSSTGFTATTRDGAPDVGDAVAYIALDFDDAQKFWAGFVTAPTATGNTTFTDPGFEGTFAGLALLHALAVGTIEADADAGAFGFAFADRQSATAGSGAAIFFEDGRVLSPLTTTQTGNQATDNPIYFPNHDGTDSHVATFNGFQSTGPRFNWSTAGTAQKWLLFQFGNHRVSGSTTFAFSGAGTAVGRGRMSGTASISFSGSGSVRGRGEVSGTAALSVQGTGTVLGRGLVDGTASLVVQGTGTILGRGLVGGSAAITFSSEGTISGVGVLDGTAAILFTGSASARGLASIAGTASLVIDGAGTVLGRAGIGGTAAIQVDASGTAVPKLRAEGAAAIVFAAEGTILGRGVLEGTAGLVFTGSGSLAATGFLSGTATIKFLVFGDLVDGASGVVPVYVRIAELVRASVQEKLFDVFGVPILWDAEDEAVGEHFPVWMRARLRVPFGTSVDFGKDPTRGRKRGSLELEIHTRAGLGDGLAILWADRVRDALVDHVRQELFFREPRFARAERIGEDWTIAVVLPFQLDFLSSEEP